MQHLLAEFATAAIKIYSTRESTIKIGIDDTPTAAMKYRRWLPKK